ncbi:phosphoribosylformylglycinamidine synthase I [bacterium]|nr:MAG: phosphoribosylformylglycinamidine synthase I [bacterium]
MRAAVIVFPGSNCDRDTYWAVEHALGESAEFVWHRDTSLSGFDLVILPGGFSYGDYLRTGAFASFSPVTKAIKSFAENGGLVLGICNGFQVLLECGLLPGAMIPNDHLRFICSDVLIRTERTDTPFSNEAETGQVLRIPVAHFEGNYFADKTVLDRIEANNQVLFRYSDSNGNVSAETNPNGSANNIAGLINERGNVVGMMPHPERASEEVLGSTDGMVIFKSILRYVEEKAVSNV